MSSNGTKEGLPSLLTVADIARMLGVSKQRADELTRLPAAARVYRGIHREPFPAPVEALATGRIWRRRDVERWIKANRGAMS